MTNNKGITLIALVITIIVLLILAGVSIAMLTGQNGILTRAGTATDETLKAEAEEAVKLAISTIRANEAAADAGANVGSDPTQLNIGNVASVAAKNNAGSVVTGSGSTITYKASANASQQVKVTLDTEWKITGSVVEDVPADS